MLTTDLQGLAGLDVETVGHAVSKRDALTVEWWHVRIINTRRTKRCMRA
jgi:hypothetical protein